MMLVSYTEKNTAPELESAVTDGEPPSPAADPVEVEEPPSRARVAPTDAQSHRVFRNDEFWKLIPAWSELSVEQFSDWRFQVRNSVTDFAGLVRLVGGITDGAFLEDVRHGILAAPMVIRLSPYILSLIDWEHPYDDPVRIQFLPVLSRKEPDHPMLRLDSLQERRDSPVHGLVHRYPGKVLFLTLDVCPVYCRFCTRSYAIGQNTGSVEKATIKASVDRWNRAFAYIASHPDVEDVVISGGDTYMLPPVQIRFIGQSLLAIPHVRRIRYATKGIAVMPTKILTHHEWREAIFHVTELGRKMSKEVCIHTHFNSTNEITDLTRQAADLLFQGGVKVRNQSVLIRGVNDDPARLVKLISQLAWMNIQPYYVYQHDMVKGVEELRTTVATNQELERRVRGSLAGFNTPLFVNDVPGGGGKRDVHSHDWYDRSTGVSIYRSPAVDSDAVYCYFDPLSRLDEIGRERWSRPEEHGRIIAEALENAGLSHLRLTM
ncbi:MAG TPA: KamA family radical SAM protein [Spirochaetia bacterium]|nr:KamA family radical SAM protein [Spirochaetia bacterium]